MTYNNYTMRTLNGKAFMYAMLLALIAGHSQQLYKVLDGGDYALVANLISIMGMFTMFVKNLSMRTTYLLLGIINTVDFIVGIPLAFGYDNKDYILVYYAITLFASTSSFILTRQVIGEAIDNSTLSMRDISSNDITIGAIGATLGTLIGLWFNTIPATYGVFIINTLFTLTLIVMLIRFSRAKQLLGENDEQ